jgi:hypothetical protein
MVDPDASQKHSNPADMLRPLSGMPSSVSGLPPRGGAPIGVRKTRLAPETLRLYASDWSRFVAYCATMQRPSLPAAAETVCDYLLSPSAGRAARPRWLAAIDHYHRARGMPPPGAVPEVRAALRRARKALPRLTRTPPPDAAALQRMALRCPGDLAGRRDRAVLLLLAAGLSRRKVVALEAERLRFAENGLAVPGLPLPLPRSPRHDLCPVRATEDWLLASATRYGPVFRKITRWGTIEPQALGPDAVRLILVRRVV